MKIYSVTVLAAEKRIINVLAHDQFEAERAAREDAGKYRDMAQVKVMGMVVKS